MRLNLVAIGRLKSGLERQLSERYWQRTKTLSRKVGISRIEWREFDESRLARMEDRRLEEAQNIKRILGSSEVLWLLDEHGKTMTSQEFATCIAHCCDRARNLTIGIGGPDGHAPELINSADRTIAFGAMTWPHQLVRILLNEQIYRSLTILAGHPYHRS